MPDISIQFYAQPDELLSFAVNVVAEFDLHVVAMHYPPFDAVELEREQLKEVLCESSSFREIAFTLLSPKLPAEGRMEFIDRNPDQLSLRIGRLTETGLEACSVSARTEDRDALAVWRKIVSIIKKQTMQGVTAVNRQTGLSASYKSFRYTEGAKWLEESGVQMLPPQGPNGPRIKLGMPDVTA